MDRRHTLQRDGSLAYEMAVYDTVSAWEERAQSLRSHIAAILGLYPRPDMAPTAVHISRVAAYRDYAVDRLLLTGPSGLICTGNLYWPARMDEPVPAVLNPHGHWPSGRLEHSSDASVRARCITFARMGMVALSYDMVGYNDSVQIRDHHFTSCRGALWGFTSMTLQAWSGLLALEYLCGLPEVDPRRIGCTGASGGATQTLMLAALDNRIAVVAPVNMISAHFQGGCECENVPGLRTDTFNVEIAALAAPRPMQMVSATGDWTLNTPHVEYPAIRGIYDLYGCTDRLAHVQIDAAHNYNAASRAPVYQWFSRWLQNSPAAEPVKERSFTLLEDAELRVFTGTKPYSVPDACELPSSWRSFMVQRQRDLWPGNAAQLARLADVTRERITRVLSLGPTDAFVDTAIDTGREPDGSAPHRRMVTLERVAQAEQVRYVQYESRGSSAGNVLLVHEAGPCAFEDESRYPGSLVMGLLERGYSACLLEPFATNAPPGALARRDADWFWSTYNRPLPGERVRDILTALTYLSQDTAATLIGLGTAATWCLLAGAVSQVKPAVCADLSGLDLDSDEAYLERLQVPLARAYDLLASASAAIAPRDQFLSSRLDWQGLAWSRQAYAVMGTANRLEHTSKALTPDTILAWKGLSPWTNR